MLPSMSPWIAAGHAASDSTSPPVAMIGTALIGYAMIAATPGPNMLVVASLSTLSGFRSVIPHCLGTATGVAALTYLVARGVGMPEPGSLGHHLVIIGSAALMLRCAWRFASSPAPASSAGRSRQPRFATGLQIALLNPMTLGYFAATLAMAKGPVSPWLPAAMAIGAGLVSLCIALVIAGLAAQARHCRVAAPVGQAIRLAVAVLLFTLAARQISTIITGA